MKCMHLASLSQVAARAAHSLNNSLAILAAAVERLEKVHGRDADAHRMLSTAQARTQEVSDCLTLLSLLPEDFPLHGGGRNFTLSAHDLTRIKSSLSSLAGVRMSAGLQSRTPARASLDGETLRCLLVCMATHMRANADSDCQITVRFRSFDVGRANEHRLIAEFELNGQKTGASGAGRRSPQLSSIALDHFLSILPAATGISINIGNDGMQFEMPAESIGQGKC